MTDTLKHSEMSKLEEYLIKNNLEYHRFVQKVPVRDQIRVFENDEEIASVICHPGSYGYKEGLLEIQGKKITGYDDVTGWQTAETIIQRLENYFGKRKEGMSNMRKEICS